MATCTQRDAERLVLSCALCSRAAVLVLCAVFDAAVEDYDTSSGLSFSVDTTTNNGESVGSALVHRLFGWAAKWDGAYFTQIAHGSGWDANGTLVLGYELEHFHAFFPLLPTLMASGAIPLQWFGLSASAAIILSGVLVSNVAFVLSAIAMFRYSCLVHRRGQSDCSAKPVPHQALVAALLYCFNPASVFMSAIYTEALFGFLSISGLLMLHSSEACASRWGLRWWLSAVLFAGCSATRSNGLLYVGYALWEVLHGPGIAPIFGGSYKASFTWPSPTPHHVESRSSTTDSDHNMHIVVTTLICELFGIVLYTSVVALPFIAYQRYSFLRYCNESAEEGAHWCEQRPALHYQHVQLQYWNIGFLHYFELKQLPNFLLAAPMLFISAAGIWNYAMADPLRFATLGFRSATLTSATPVYGVSGDYISSSSVACDINFASNLLMLPHVYLYTFLVLFATFVMHVQVATRFLATSPLLYWWLADRMFRLPMAHGGVVDASAQANTTVGARTAASFKKVQPHGQLHGGPATISQTGLRFRKHEGQGQNQARQRRRASSPSPSGDDSSRKWPAGNSQRSLWEPAVLIYFATYCVLGCALFSNYYPWT